MPHVYTEDQPFEQPAVGLIVELRWSDAGPLDCIAFCDDPRDAGLRGRETKGDIVLVSLIRASLEWLNPLLSPEATTAAANELTRDRLFVNQLLEHVEPASVGQFTHSVESRR